MTYPLPARIIHAFPPGTWIENLAVRPNSQILATELPQPRLYQIDPFTPHAPILLHSFPETASLLGIVETSPDIFHIATSNYTSATLESYGEDYIFKIDMRSFSPHLPNSAKITKVATLPQAKSLNGLTFLGEDSGLLLASDFISGVIFSIDITTGASRVVINNTYTRSTGFGVNGLQYHHINKHLYFSNSQHEELIKVPVNAKGEAVGNFTVLAKGGFEPDDFALDAKGDAYVTSFTKGKNGLVFVPREGGEGVYVAGVAGPTACAFGRGEADKEVLYVSTSGGDYEYESGAPVRVRGKIVRVDVGRRGGGGG